MLSGKACSSQLGVLGQAGAPLYRATLHADVLGNSSQIVATGGLSFPKMGTDGTGHRLVARLGHAPTPVYPALTPLKGAHPAQAQLAGTLRRLLPFFGASAVEKT